MQLSFAASYREDTPVRVAVAALALLAAAVGLTFLFQILDIGSQQSVLDRLLRMFGTTAKTIGTATVWTMAVAALLVLGLAILMLRDTGPMLRIDAHGVMDRLWSAKPVGWMNIAEFDAVRMRGLDLVLVRLKDPALDPPQTWLARLARHLGIVPAVAVLIPVDGLDCAAPDLCDKILEIGTPVIHAAEDAAERTAADAPDGAAMHKN